MPRTNPNAYGAQVFGTLAEITAAMRDKQKPIDAAKQISDYNIAVNDLKNEVQADPDPNNWRQEFVKREAQLRQSMLDQISDSGVKEAFSLQTARSYDTHINDISEKGIRASHDKQRAEVLTVGDTLAQLAADATDPRARESFINTYNSMVRASASPTTVG